MMCLVAFLVLSGCSGAAKQTANEPGSSSEAINDASTTNDQSAATDSGEVVELTYATWGSPNEKKAHQAAVDAFNAKYPNIKVKYLHIPADFGTKISTMIAAKQAPDVFLLDKVTALKWSEQKKLYNIKPFLDADSEISEDKLIPNAVLYMGPDQVAGIKATEEAFGLFYNKDMFTEAGVPVPPANPNETWTWEQFVEAAQKLTLDNKGRNALDPEFNPKNIKQYGVRFNRWAWFQLFGTNETKLVSEDGTKLQLTDPAVADSIQKLADLINVYHVAPDVTQEKSLPAPAVALQSKKVAMDLDGQWVQVDLGASKINWDVGAMPKIKVPSTLLNGEPFVMSADTKHPKEAWQFYKFMIDPNNVLELYSSGLWMPIVREWYEKPELMAKWAEVTPGHSPGYKQAIMEMTTQYGVNAHDYTLKNADKINALIGPALDAVWEGKKSAADSLKAVEPKVQAEFKGIYGR